MKHEQYQVIQWECAFICCGWSEPSSNYMYTMYKIKEITCGCLRWCLSNNSRVEAIELTVVGSRDQRCSISWDEIDNQFCLEAYYVENIQIDHPIYCRAPKNWFEFLLRKM